MPILQTNLAPVKNKILSAQYKLLRNYLGGGGVQPSTCTLPGSPFLSTGQDDVPAMWQDLEEACILRNV